MAIAQSRLGSRGPQRSHMRSKIKQRRLRQQPPARSRQALAQPSDRQEVEPLAGIENQFGRRNLADIDRISLAVKREDIISKKAKANLKTPTGGRGMTPAKLPKSKPAVDTRKESAKSAGVGERTYDAGKRSLKRPTNRHQSRDHPAPGNTPANRDAGGHAFLPSRGRSFVSVRGHKSCRHVLTYARFIVSP